MIEWNRYRQGMVRLCVTGGWIERFINCCLASGMVVWQIRTDGRNTLFWMRIEDYRRIRPIARISKVRVRIVARKGCPFLWHRLTKRKGLIVGPMIACTILYLCTLFVWQVEVVGNRIVDAEEIYELARAENIYVGALCSAIRPREAQEMIVANCGQLVWCGIHREGTRVVIEVVEKTLRRTSGEGVGDIVADKSGIITEMIVLRGTGMVAVGDTVSEGAALIAGREPNYGEERAEIETKPVRAKGIIKARVWHEGCGKASVATVRRSLENCSAYSVTVRLGEWDFSWQSDSISQFALWEKDKRIWQWRNQIVPVEIITDIYYECEPITEADAWEEAKTIATEQAWQSVANQIPKDARICDKRIEIAEDTQARIVEVRTFAETEEEVGILVN